MHCVSSHHSTPGTWDRPLFGMRGTGPVHESRAASLGEMKCPSVSGVLLFSSLGLLVSPKYSNLAMAVGGQFGAGTEAAVGPG